MNLACRVTLSRLLLLPVALPAVWWAMLLATALSLFSGANYFVRYAGWSVRGKNYGSSCRGPTDY